MNHPDSSQAPTILNEAGEFQVEDDVVDLSVYHVEDWLGFVVFSLLGLTVFYQFFTRYGLNNSAAWTEEIARYLLVCTVFIGMIGAVRINSHIHVDFFYHWLPRWITRTMSTLVDIIRIAFFSYAAYLTYQLIQRIGGQPMSVAPIPFGYVYAVVMLSFGGMTIRAVQLAIIHWRQGYSILERPDVAV